MRNAGSETSLQDHIGALIPRSRMIAKKDICDDSDVACTFSFYPQRVRVPTILGIIGFMLGSQLFGPYKR